MSDLNIPFCEGELSEVTGRKRSPWRHRAWSITGTPEWYW